MTGNKVLVISFNLPSFNSDVIRTNQLTFTFFVTLSRTVKLHPVEIVSVMQARGLFSFFFFFLRLNPFGLNTSSEQMSCHFHTWDLAAQATHQRSTQDPPEELYFTSRSFTKPSLKATSTGMHCTLEIFSQRDLDCSCFVSF